MRNTAGHDSKIKGIRKSIARLAGKNWFAGREIAIFGAGMDMLPVMECLRERSLGASAIIDNARSKAGKVCRGLVVRAPEDYLPSRKGRVRVLLYLPAYRGEMSRQLERMGCV